MALTAVAIIYSPWGRRSGAHMNPATTLAFSRLGKVEPEDALFYVLAQFAGGAAGLSLALGLLGRRLADPPVHYVATLPGADGALAAFLAEVGIAFLMMLVVLLASNQPRLAGFTGLLVGLLLFSYITLEAPVSGMSLNPARTFASALPGRLWGALWVYFTAPPLGMLAAAQIYTMLRGAEKVHCAKLHHDTVQRCIFRCNYAELVRMKPPSGAPPPASAS
jgi:aquaporin Z